MGLGEERTIFKKNVLVRFLKQLEKVITMNSIIVVVIVLFVWPFHVECVSNVKKYFLL
jgi:hypothetical protein